MRLSRLARSPPRISWAVGADLANMMNEAAINAVRTTDAEAVS